MPFAHSVRDEVLMRSHRRGCVCHEFAGRSVNVHHIIQEADGGPNTIENAVCLCLRCHAEAGHFNPRHPLGTKYSPDGLRAHRDQWWQYCLNHPDEDVPSFPLPAGRGGRGGDATVRGSGVAVGGPGGGGGVPGAGSGGDGGSAAVACDGLAMGGEGGEAGQADHGDEEEEAHWKSLGYQTNNFRMEDGCGTSAEAEMVNLQVVRPR